MLNNELRNYREALGFFDRSLELSRSLALVDSIAVALLGRGNALNRLAEYDDAVASLEEARKLLEDGMTEGLSRLCTRVSARPS